MAAHLSIPIDYHGTDFSRLAPVNTRRFLQAMLAEAPWSGIEYVSRKVLDTAGGDVELQRLAARWFHEMIVPRKFADAFYFADINVIGGTISEGKQRGLHFGLRIGN